VLSTPLAHFFEESELGTLLTICTKANMGLTSKERQEKTVAATEAARNASGISMEARGDRSHKSAKNWLSY